MTEESAAPNTLITLQLWICSQVWKSGSVGCSNDSLVLPSALQQALMFGVVNAKRVNLREWMSISPRCFKNGWTTWFLVYTERKDDILCLSPTLSLRRSGACSLNISGGKEHRLGIDCALFINSFIYVSTMFTFFPVWLWRIVLFLFSIYTWDSDILLAVGLGLLVFISDPFLF